MVAESGRTAIRLALGCLVVTALLPGAACGGDGVEWGYSGPGAPEHWASLSDEYVLCAEGTQQSPIDIAGYEQGDAEPISLEYSGHATSITNDGRFLRVDYLSGNTFGVGPRSYQLKSAHFHAPSENRIDGVSYAAELHLVHENARGEPAVVGVLFTLGAASPVVQAVLDAAPPAGDTLFDVTKPNAGEYVPDDLSHYRYDGSRTTPPCDEPVEWFVMREQWTVSQEQVDALLELSGGPNNRPVQPIGDRVITLR